jgi:hypothetical protein
MTALSVAAAGMLDAERRFDASASRVAAMGQDPGGVDPGLETVSQIEAATQFKADVNVVKFADDMWRALLDVQTR